MCDKLTIEIANREYEKVWVGTDMAEALNILSYRMKLTAGDCIELTDGTEAIVVDNTCSNEILTCATPMLGERYGYGCNHFSAPYNVVKCPIGVAVDVDDVIRVEGPGIVRRLIEREAWQEAADMLDTLRSISVDISEFAGDMATIFAGIQEDKRNEEKAAECIAKVLETKRAN